MGWVNVFANNVVVVLNHSDNADDYSKDGVYSQSPLLSTEDSSLTIFILNHVIGLLLMTVGFTANILNIIAFRKQGFKDTINISLTSLSASDLAFHVFTFWQTLCMIDPLQQIRWPYNFGEIVIITGSLPRNCLSRISSVITVFIAVERCVSVIMPLKVKFIFTRKRIIRAQFAIYVVNLLPFIMPFFTMRLGWRLDRYTNRTALGLVRIRGHYVYFLDVLGMSIGIFLLFSSFITVALCTVILVTTLSRQSRWRIKMTQGLTGQETHAGEEKTNADGAAEASNPKSAGEKNKSPGGSMSERDKRAAKTVITLALMYVLCYLPSVIFQIAIILAPEFTRRGRYSNAYLVFGILGFRTEGICASANIFVYYNTSEKYRESLQSALCSCRKKK